LLLLLAVTLPSALFAQDVVTRYDQDSRYYRIIVRDYLERDRRILYFSRTRGAQSSMIISDPTRLGLSYLRTSVAALAAHEDPQDVLVVGLGGGAMPKFLAEHYPDLNIDVVEIDPDVVRVAQDYFEFEPTSNMRVFAVDGRIFLREVDKSYDVILLDAYGSDRIPFHLTTVEFFELVRERLNPNGVVSLNLWEALVNRFYFSILRTMQSVFPELYLFQTPDPQSKIAFATNFDETITRDQWIRQAEAFEGDRDLEFDLPELVAREYDRITDQQFSEDILTDDKAPVDILRSQAR
jgi:spermidine synthase